MKRIIALFLVLAVLPGCEGKFIKHSVPNTCGNTGWTLTTVHYGDSYLAVIPLSEVVEDAEWRFVLDPQDDATHGNAIVKVRGKRDGVQVPQTDDAWFVEAQGTANGDGSIKVCVDGGAVDVGDTVQYDVEVVGVGELDPRARVITPPY